MTEEVPFDVSPEPLDYMVAFVWICFATRLEPDEVGAWGLEPDQTIALGTALSRNPLLNPPRHRPEKVLKFTCSRCGRRTKRSYRTRRPKLCYDCAR